MRDASIIKDLLLALIATGVVSAVSVVLSLFITTLAVPIIIILSGSTGLLAYLYRRRLQKESALGVKDIYSSFKQSPSPHAILNSATSSFFFLGTSGRSFFVLDSDLYKLLEDKLKQGVVMKFLLLDPESPNLQRRAKDEGYNEEAMRRDIDTSIERLVELKNTYSDKKVDYATYTSYPIWRCIFIDEREVYVSYYPLGSFGDKSPSVKFMAQIDQANVYSFYKAFRTYFEEMWHMSIEQKRQRKLKKPK